MESCLKEPGDVVAPLAEGLISEAHCRGTLGQLLAGTASGRRAADEVTLFESLGLAIEDCVAALEVLEAAEREGAGVSVGLNG